MIIRPEAHQRIVINLDGPDGNAFALLGMAKGWAKQLELNWPEIQAEATSSDYRKLVLTLNKVFGEVIDFQTEQENLLEMDETEIEIKAKMSKMGYK